MPDKSSYLQYLPPVLWEKEPPPPDFSLGAMLRIFEKILMGLDDDVVIQHGDHAHEPVEVVIARLHQLFHPWFTPPEFLDWLATWVSLEFPAIWDDYQRRKVTSEIVQIYGRRGLKEGLDQYLDLYTVAEKRPRIAVDDCSKILVARPEPERFVPLHTLVSHGPSVQDGIAHHEGLIGPLCMTLAPDRSLFVGDIGTPDGWTPVIPEGVWRLPPPGQYDFTGAPPIPQRLGPSGWNLEFPAALVTDTANPWHLYVLDRLSIAPPTNPVLYELTSPDFAAATPLISEQDLGTVWPVAMALDSNGHLLILDRGVSAPSGNAAIPKIIDFQVGGPPPVTTNLTQVIEPLSLLVQPNGDLIIGDAREQNAAVPAALVRVNRTNPANWIEAPLTLSPNPLVAPMAVVRGDDDHIFVLDLGLKAYFRTLDPALAAEPFRRNIAEPAAIYRVDIGQPTSVVTRVTETRQLVHPTGMVLDEGTLYVCDRGENQHKAIAGAVPRTWRASAHEFGVVVYFSEQRPTTPLERRRIVQNIYEIIQVESPAHTAWTMVYSV